MIAAEDAELKVLLIVLALRSKIWSKFVDAGVPPSAIIDASAPSLVCLVCLFFPLLRFPHSLLVFHSLSMAIWPIGLSSVAFAPRLLVGLHPLVVLNKPLLSFGLS